MAHSGRQLPYLLDSCVVVVLPNNRAALHLMGKETSLNFTVDHVISNQSPYESTLLALLTKFEDSLMVGCNIAESLGNTRHTARCRHVGVVPLLQLLGARCFLPSTELTLCSNSTSALVSRCRCRVHVQARFPEPLQPLDVPSAISFSATPA